MPAFAESVAAIAVIVCSQYHFPELTAIVEPAPKEPAPEPETARLPLEKV